MVPKTLLKELRLTIRLSNTWRAPSATTVTPPKVSRSPSKILQSWQMALGCPVSAKALWQWADVQTELRKHALFTRCPISHRSTLVSAWVLLCCRQKWLHIGLWATMALDGISSDPLTLLFFIPGRNSGQSAAMWGTAVHPQLCMKPREHTSSSLLHWESFPTSTPLRFLWHPQETCTSQCWGKKASSPCWSHL